MQIKTPPKRGFYFVVSVGDSGGVVVVVEGFRTPTNLANTAVVLKKFHNISQVVLKTTPKTIPMIKFNIAFPYCYFENDRIVQKSDASCGLVTY